MKEGMIQEFWTWMRGLFGRSSKEMGAQQNEGNPPVIDEGPELPAPSGEVVRALEPVQGQEGVLVDEGILVPPPEPPSGLQRDHANWEVRPCKVREFDKFGRLFLEGGDLVIKIDGMPFCVVLGRDLKQLIAGEPVDLKDTVGHNSVGTAQPSTSGRAINIRIGERLFTVPLRNVVAVVEGRVRKAAVFAGNGGG